MHWDLVPAFAYNLKLFRAKVRNADLRAWILSLNLGAKGAITASAVCEAYAQSQCLLLISSTSCKLKLANMHFPGASTTHCERVKHSTQAADVYEAPREPPWYPTIQCQPGREPPTHAMATQQILESPFSFTCFTEPPYTHRFSRITQALGDLNPPEFIKAGELPQI